MKKFIIFSLLILLSSKDGRSQSHELRQTILKQIAEKEYGPTFSVISARLQLGIKKEIALMQLDTLLSREYGDMFWMYSCAGLYLSAKTELPEEYRSKIRECWKKFTPYRGDTENHFLMYYGSLYLLSEEWPNLSDTEWFMHRSSIEIHSEAESYLNFWINRTVRFGQIEFDSPRYLYYFITPLVLLHEFAKDTVMKKKCGMLLESILVDYASQYLDGNFCGANSRLGDNAAFDTRKSEATSYGEYFFEDSVKHILPDLAFAAMSSFAIPSIIRKIANDREEPYLQQEAKRGRDAIRYSQELNKAVNKCTFMTKDFALGSIQGGLIQPIQQRSWSLVLNSEHPNNIIFGLHPYVSEKELGAYFPEEPSFMLGKIDAIKHGYTNEDKWIGGSPYESIKQYKNQIECKYNIPKKEKYQHVDLFFPGWGEFLPGDAQHPKLIRIRYDSSIVSIVTHTPFEWKPEGENFRLRLSLIGRKTSYFISCDRADEFSEFDDRTSMTILKGNKVQASQDQWLYSSKFLESKLGSGVLKMKYGANERVLDFTTVTIR